MSSKLYFVLLLVWLLTPKYSLAASALLINEFLPHPSSGNDWFEVYNNSGSTINLSGYKVNDSTSTIKQFGSSDTIDPYCYLAVDVSNRLNNSGDSLTLYDSTSTKLDDKSYSADPGIDVSWQRQPDGADWTTSSTVTKSLPNSGDGKCGVVTSSSQTISIELSEVMPNPNKEDEWVEIYNKNNYSSDLSGLIIDDEEGGSSPYAIPSATAIAAASYLVVSFASARFNNDGDQVRLIGKDGKVIESYSYSSSVQGHSFAKDEHGSWHETDSPTKGSPNIISLASSSTSSQNSTAKPAFLAASSSVSPSPLQSPKSSDKILGSRSASLVAASESGNVGKGGNEVTPSGNYDRSAKESPEANGGYKAGIIFIFWGCVILGVIGYFLKRKGFFGKIRN